METKFISYVFSFVLKYAAMMLLITTIVFHTYLKIRTFSRIKLPMKAYLMKSYCIACLQIHPTTVFNFLFESHRFWLSLVISATLLFAMQFLFV